MVHVGLEGEINLRMRNISTVGPLHQLFSLFLSPCFYSYVMSSGYKPAPLDLNHVKLTPNQNQLVEKLAENGHNVWARDRVKQGWTYSIVQVLTLWY